MNRAQLEHVIRAAATIVADDEIVVIGSQAILGQFPDAPAELLVSMEADVYPKNRPERADVIDGAIGELSLFHDTFGYYAQGVAPETATFPTGWEERALRIEIAGSSACGLCPEIHDLVVSKLIAGREKDLAFAEAVARHGLADAAVLRARVAATALEDEVRARVTGRVERIFGPRA